MSSTECRRRELSDEEEEEEGGGARGTVPWCGDTRPPVDNGGRGSDLVLDLLAAKRPSLKLLSVLPETEEDREPVSSVATDTLASDVLSPSAMLKTRLMALGSWDDTPGKMGGGLYTWNGLWEGEEGSQRPAR